MENEYLFPPPQASMDMLNWTFNESFHSMPPDTSVVDAPSSGSKVLAWVNHGLSNVSYLSLV
jgi:hypothetical protein